MKYISILRGINVSGQKKIKMADLKALYESLGFDHVATYIQSGNVIFKSKKKKIELSAIIEQAIEKQYGFYVPVLIRSVKEMGKVIDNCPFNSLDLEENCTKVLVTFLESVPTKSGLNKLMEYVKAPEELVSKGSEIYLYCPNGYGKSKLSNNFLEQKLGLTATTRNWKSVVKLYELVMS